MVAFPLIGESHESPLQLINQKGVIGLTDEIKTIAKNKKAYHDYFVLEKYEAGIELFGTEIKSIRAGRVNLKDSFCSVDDGEMYAIGMHISPYEQGNRFNREPLRKKKLLLHKKEIMKLFGESQQQGLSIIPLELYIKNGRAKLEIGLCKGKKLYDKRADAAKKAANRTMEREFKERY
ncbi:MAG: SsrA-binding protein SmpB [Eubacterium sp.]|nr:SsrA-binding protein SmpB [Eubacterium sp.]